MIRMTHSNDTFEFRGAQYSTEEPRYNTTVRSHELNGEDSKHSKRPILLILGVFTRYKVTYFLCQQSTLAYNSLLNNGAVSILKRQVRNKISYDFIRLFDTSQITVTKYYVSCIIESHSYMHESQGVFMDRNRRRKI